MVFDKIQSLCPDHYTNLKLHKKPFLISRSHPTTSAFVTNCLGTNMADSNRRQDKSHEGENREYGRSYHFLFMRGFMQLLINENHTCEPLEKKTITKLIKL